MTRGSQKTPVCVFWFRRDLRLADNRGLAQALSGDIPVLPLFIFDELILNKLADRDDRRVTFIHQTLSDLRVELQKADSDLLVEHGKPVDIFRSLLAKHQIVLVVTNHDYEPYAIERDDAVRSLLATHDVPFETFKDQVIFEKDEVTKDDGKPYTVFTPYSRKWKTRLSELKKSGEDVTSPASSQRRLKNLFAFSAPPIPTLKALGFEKAEFSFPPSEAKKKIIANYATTRDFPAIKGTSHLGLHLRFGTVSVRDLVRRARADANDDVWLNELIWREFFMQILWHFPHVTKGPFRPQYAAIEWRHDKKEFAAWCEGRTGYPIVDAGMRELNATGFMHNRVRMIAASFLVKHLLIDWRWGEAYFARQLLDFELASNNGNWQWVAGTGCDAAPYFRVFNPESQTKKFDRENHYIQKWIPELRSEAYPEPIVDHIEARTRVLRVYKSGLSRAAPTVSRAR